jgi:hypothetical protein
MPLQWNCQPGYAGHCSQCSAHTGACAGICSNNCWLCRFMALPGPTEMMRSGSYLAVSGPRWAAGRDQPSLRKAGSTVS